MGFLTTNLQRSKTYLNVLNALKDREFQKQFPIFAICKPTNQIMIKTARQILLEHGLDLNSMRKLPMDSKARMTVGFLDSVSKWIDRNRIGQELELRPVYDGDVRDTLNRPTKYGYAFRTLYTEGFPTNFVLYDVNKIMSPQPLLEALGFKVFKRPLQKYYRVCIPIESLNINHK